MNESGIGCCFVAVLVVVVATVLCSIESVDTGNVGIVTSFGEVQNNVMTPGLNFKPFWQKITELSCKVQSHSVKTECFSKDLQQVEISTTIQYRLDEKNAPSVFAKVGPKYIDQVIPRLYECLKQEVSKYDSENIVSKRETIRRALIDDLKTRVSDLVEIKDIIITDVGFSNVYEKAIEAKQVALQESLRAKYELERAKIESEKTVALAEGEAKAIAIKGDAIKSNPGVVQLSAIDKWNGVSPTTVVIGAGTDVPVVFPVK